MLGIFRDKTMDDRLIYKLNQDKRIIKVKVKVKKLMVYITLSRFDRSPQKYEAKL